MIGFINVYKPSNITSNAVVQKIKKQFNIKKIGHMGTLDPLACGLLPIAVGKATRLFDYFLQKKKIYNVIFDFGYETDTLDITGQVINATNVIPNEIELINAVNLMIGKQLQMPPKYSAKNINGKRAYDLARNGINFELKPNEIEIFEFDLIEKISETKYKFKIVCSSGTYIRAIGRDLAKYLNTFATMSFLERVEMGYFDIENSIKLDDLLQLESIDDVLISALKVFSHFDSINIDDATYKDLVDGKVVERTGIKNNTFVINNSIIVGVATPRENQLKIDTFLKE